MRHEVSASNVIALGLVVGLFATDQQAKAAEPYGSFVVRNPSNVPLHYQVKWGDGDWQSYCVYAGYTRWHSNTLNQNGQVPTPQIRFDCMAGDDEVTYKTYELDVYATYCPENGKRYVFRFSRCGGFVNLYCD